MSITMAIAQAVSGLRGHPIFVCGQSATRLLRLDRRSLRCPIVLFVFVILFFQSSTPWQKLINHHLMAA